MVDMTSVVLSVETAQKESDALNLPLLFRYPGTVYWCVHACVYPGPGHSGRVSGLHSGCDLRLDPRRTLQAGPCDPTVRRQCGDCLHCLPAARYDLLTESVGYLQLNNCLSKSYSEKKIACNCCLKNSIAHRIVYICLWKWPQMSPSL